VSKKLLAPLSFVLLTCVAKAHSNFVVDFGPHAEDYSSAFTLARFLGLFLLVIGLTVFVKNDQKAYFDQLVESKEFLFITGLMTVILGALIIALNNTWRFDWRLLITILGWATLLKGAVMLIFPEYSVLIWNKLSVKRWLLLISGAISFIIGIYLIGIGFGL
jgi:hypothetical protein